MGGGGEECADDGEHDAPPSEVSNYPLRDAIRTISLCFQRDEISSIPTKTRKSQSDLNLKQMDEIYSPLLTTGFARDAGATTPEVQGFGTHHANMVALQQKTIALARKHQNADVEEELHDDPIEAACLSSSASQPADPEIVPLPLAMQGPAVVALKLLRDANCTEEQIDAVALLALSLQKRFDARPDKSCIRLPVATPINNHRAIWLGGGGVGKTRTLCMVVQPLAETYFGPGGYAAAAQSNQAAQNLGSRSRTLHAANGILMGDSLQTARLRLNPQTQKKMDRFAGGLGVDVIDELGCVPADLLHADALRKMYGRCQRHKLDTTKYMSSSEAWGRMPCNILCGDFYQLPPVPASSSLLAPPDKQSYEHQQGRKLLMDMEYVIEFVQMQRFDDPLLVEVLEAMRTPGGKQISKAAWKALEATVIGAPQPDAVIDSRLAQARGWYECAYEWRIVCYAMHAHARLNAAAAGKTLFYVPAIDAPAARMAREEYDAMRAYPNVGNTAKLLGILPLYIGMDMVLTETYLPPHIVRGTPVEVVDIELHPREPSIHARDSIGSHSCVVLHFMPKCIYVRVRGSKASFLVPGAGAVQPGVKDMRGILAVQPKTRPWQFKGKGMVNAIPVSRTQCPLLPQRQSTLHAVQGKTADPGFIAHWKFPKGLTKESVWLAYYVSLSRPRRLSCLLSNGLPDRQIIEGGPPESITEAFQDLFRTKIAATQRACAAARTDLGWPARAG